MTEHPVERLSAYADGELSSQEAAGVEQPGECGQRHEHERRHVAAVAQSER